MEDVRDDQGREEDAAPIGADVEHKGMYATAMYKKLC